MSNGPTAREIIDANGHPDDDIRMVDPQEDGSRMHPDVTAYLSRRSTAFAEATSREPGKAMTYGQIKKEAGKR